MFKLLFNVFYLALAWLVAANFSWALEADRQLAIEVTAQQMSWHNQTQRATYQGKVEATQGELFIQSDLLEITRTTLGELKQAQASNKQGLAYLRDLPQLEEPQVEAWAETINFLAEENLVILTGKAKLLQGEDSFTGHQLTYNLVTQDIQAAQKSGAKSTDSRVKAIFTPKPNSTNP